MKKLSLHFLLLSAVIISALGFTSCETDDTDERWYLNGTWQCMQYPDEYLFFSMDGTGYWQDYYTGDYEDFNYFCDGNYLRFRWFPQYGPSYTEDCTIFMTNGNAMQITYPPTGASGPVTLYYSRVN